MSGESHDPEHPLFARVYDPVMALPERFLLADHRAHLAEGLSGLVLDIGSGTGAMFPHYPATPEVTVHAVEPDPHMRRQATERADRLPLDPAAVDAGIEDLPHPQHRVHAAGAGRVLSSVPDLRAGVAALAGRVPVAGLTEPDAEPAPPEKARARLADGLARTRGKLDNAAFVEKAPAEVVQRERDKQAETESALARIDEQIRRVERL